MMNSHYLDKTNLKVIAQHFEKTKMVRLDGFIEENLYEILKREINDSKFKHKKIPNSFSFSKSSNSKLTNQILNSQEMIYIIKNITHQTHKKIRLETKKFSHRDYIIIKDKKRKESRLQFLFFISELWNPNWGGNKVLIKKEKSYIFPPQGNSFVLFQKDKEDRDFIQYLNHLSKDAGFILIEGILN